MPQNISKKGKCSLNSYLIKMAHKNLSRPDISQNAEGPFPASRSCPASPPEMDTSSCPHDAGDSRARSSMTLSDFLNPRHHHHSVKCYQPDLLRGKNVKKNETPYSKNDK